jgi:Lrp/AsnC family leucine-responsive transcriptional regulator
MPTNHRPNGASGEEPLLDATNRRLLAELQLNARVTQAELARRVGLSSPAVAERLQRLEAQKVIRGYRTEIDPAAVGLNLSAVIRVRPGPRQLHKVAELARSLTEIVQCDRITGEDCYLIQAHVRDVGHLEELIDALAPYGQTTTSIVQSSPVPPRGLALGDTAPAPAGVS